MQITERISAVRQRIAVAAQVCARAPENIALLAVSKTRTSQEIAEAVSAGLTAFGENYLQEALPKIEALRELPLQWHFIGPVQSNKTRDLAAHFDWVQSVDRLKIARRLSEQRAGYGPPLNICVQVNIDREPQKAGVLPEGALSLCQAITELPRLRLRGIMVIPEASDDTGKQFARFSTAHALFAQLNSAGLALDTLSMGMSNDLEAAIRAGSQMVRIGTDIFGPRGK